MVTLSTIQKEVASTHGRFAREAVGLLRKGGCVGTASNRWQRTHLLSTIIPWTIRMSITRLAQPRSTSQCHCMDKQHGRAARWTIGIPTSPQMDHHRNGSDPCHCCQPLLTLCLEETPRKSLWHEESASLVVITDTSTSHGTRLHLVESLSLHPLTSTTIPEGHVNDMICVKLPGVDKSGIIPAENWESYVLLHISYPGDLNDRSAFIGRVVPQATIANPNRRCTSSESTARRWRAKNNGRKW